MMQEKFRVPTRVLDVQTVDIYGNNLLHFAIVKQFYDLVEELVREEGMDIYRLRDGLTPLEVATAVMPGKGTLKIMKLLIRCGANPVVKVENESFTILDPVVFFIRLLADLHSTVNLMTLPIGNVTKFLVEDIGLPVTQNVLDSVTRVPEIFAMCQNARSSPRSLKKLARLTVLKTHKVDKMPDGYIPEELKFFLGFKEGDDE